MSANAPITDPVHSESLRLVLFGLPNAGKSSLLGALGQAKKTQEHLLDGKLADSSHGLEEQSRYLYEHKPHRTTDEIVPYAVKYQPRHGAALSAVIVDCDGRVANDLLASKRVPDENSREGSLAHEIVDADTLILVVDASSPPAQVEADFAEFGQFLRLLEKSRGSRTDVGGLPVFLVLTKCDLLAQPNDSNIDWIERIEARKSEAAGRFREVMSRGGKTPIFGRLELNLWATAVKHPALKEIPAKPREPYLVAELFRQCLTRAATHRDQVNQSERRLKWTVGGAGGIAAAILAGIVGLFFAGNGEPPSALQLAIETLMFSDLPTAGERLRGSPVDLRERLEKLNAIRNGPGFDVLAVKYRDFVQDRAGELKTYLAYTEKLRQARRPADATREDTLREIQLELTNALALPDESWAITEAGKVRQERLDEIDALTQAISKVRDNYLESVDQARELWTFARHQGTAETPGINWRMWLDEVEPLLDLDRPSPFDENGPLPGAPALTYAGVMRFDKIVEVRSEWEGMRKKLERVRDVCAAVGLVTGVKGKPPVLLIPRTGFTLEVARERLRELQDAYPTYRIDFTRTGLPDALLPEMSRWAQTSYEYLLEPGRAAVLKKLKQSGEGPEETPARWNAVRTWLVEPTELADWRVLALILSRLHAAEAVDPVTALASFLQKTSFVIDLRSLTVDVPESFKIKPPLNATFNIAQTRDGVAKTSFNFAMDGEGERIAQDRLWRYRFTLQNGSPLTYLPGDELTITLPLRDDQMLSWGRNRSSMYQFERLSHAPRLYKAIQMSGPGLLIEKVHLIAMPQGAIPTVPDLLPNLDRR